MSQPNYILTVAAEADLRGIIRHTRQQWGEAQVRRYVALLERSISRLAAGEGSYKSLDEIYPSLRVARCEHHYVFCLPRENTPALIVAIFHEKMELMVRLMDRLV